MSLILTPPAGSPSSEPRRAGTTTPWLPAGALLLAEYLLTSYAVDIRPLAERSDWLGTFGSAGDTGPILLSIATATALIGGRRLLAELRAVLDRAAEGPTAPWPLGRLTSFFIHGAAFAAFLFLTIFFTRAGEPLPSGAGLLGVAWVASAVVAVIAVVHVVVPLAALLPVARRTGPALAAGAALGLAAWAAGGATVHFWDPLREPTLQGVAAVLRTVATEVAFDAATSTMTLEGFSIVISPACSGYEGVGLLTVLMSAYLWAFRTRLRFPHVLAVLPIGICLCWLANVLRISALMVVGARWSYDLALGSFHSKAGWVLFCAIALGLIALTRSAPIFRRATESADHGATSNPTAAYLSPLLALVAVHMATGLFTEGLPVLYPLGVLAAAGTLWWYRRFYPRIFRPSWSWQACAIGVAAFALWILLEPTHDVAALDDWQRALAALPVPLAAAWVAFRSVGSFLVVPVVEELAFRGYLLRRLLSSDFSAVPFVKFSWLSLMGSSLAYGLLHERWLAGILAGVLFAFAQYRRGRLTDAVLAHAVTNLLLAIHAIESQRWTLWG